jgi:hypothetical protein
MSAKKYMIFMMVLDKNVFGDRLYKITDTTAFGRDSLNRITKYIKINGVSVGETNNSNLNLTPTLEICYTFYVVGGEIMSCPPDVDHCIQLIEMEACIDYEMGGGGGIGSGGTGSNGTGSTGTGGTGTGSTGSGGSNTPGGGSCGNCGGWTPIVYHPAILYVMTTISNDDPDWFAQSVSHTQLAIKVQNYLIQNSNSAQAISLSQVHCYKMMSDPAYLSFVNNHMNYNIQNVYYAYQTEVINDVTNPCLLSVISEIGVSGYKSTLLNLFQDHLFNQKSPYRIKFQQSISVIGNSGEQVYARNEPIVDLPDGKKQITITLNKTLLNSGVSKEYIGAIIVHELLHGMFLTSDSYNSLSQEEQHLKFFNSYTIGIGMSLKELFPSLTDVDATALALEGLDDVTFPGGNISPTLNGTAETNYGMGLIYAKNQANKYKNPSSGFGTYC